MAGLKLSHIYKVYENGHKAVNDFNIDIADKEFIVFVGPSGCGKSTTLRMVAGLEEISAGDLFIGDTLVNDMEPKDRDIAMVFQNYALYPHMSVFDNMAFGLRNRKVPEPEIKEAVTNAAKILGIEDYLDRKPKAMSGGQRQRVALGRAIVRKPKVFLFDEPLSNLDAKLRAQMRTEITKLHKKLETTFIYVTHDQIEAMTMGTRIVVMKLGYVQQIDTPMNLYNKPHNKFVAGFIGTPQMNFFDVTLKREGDNVKMTFVNTGDVLTIPYEKLAKAPDRFLHGDVVVTFGIRPDHVRIVEEETGLSCVANVVEHLGNECLVYGDVAGKNGEENESLSNVNQIIVKTIETPEYQPGMKFNLTIDLDRIHLFEKSPELDEKAEDFKIKDALPTRDVTILEDIPAYSTFPAKIAGGKIALLDANVELPPALKDALEGASEIKVDIPANAAIPGKDYTLTVHNCEEIDGKYLLHLVVGDRYLFLLNDEPVKVGSKFSFALRNDKLVFHGANNELLLDAIPDNNTFIGTFAKSEKRENHERVIDFFYNINEAHILAPRNNGYRINAVEGNKCYRNEYKYVVPVECVTLGDPIQAPAVEGKPSKIITPTEGINANVTGLLDYGNIVYATLQLGEQKGLAIVERGAALNDVSVRFGGENVEVYSIDIDMRVC